MSRTIRVSTIKYDKLYGRADKLGVSPYYIVGCLIEKYLADPDHFIVPIPVETTQVLFS